MSISAPHQHCIELPAPPAGLKGWPWEAQPIVFPENLKALPRITLITPSFNQGRFIERTLRSIHAQGYPNLEHLVIDGASTDETGDVLKKYAHYLSYWVSEPDRGQTHAINKGLTRATGEIVNWINSDDILFPGALFEVAKLWGECKPTPPHLIMGGAVVVNVEGKVLNKGLPQLPDDARWALAYWRVAIPQPSTFISRELFQRLGPLSEAMNFRMDWEFYLRAAVVLGKDLRISKTERFLSEILYHPDCKSMKFTDGFRREAMQVWRALLPSLPLAFRLRIRYWLAWFESMIFMEQQSAGRVGPARLFLEIISRPWMWPFRYTWGALRKSLNRY